MANTGAEKVINNRLPYWQQMLDPRWQRRRLEIFNRDGFKCRECNSQTETLSVHHSYYEKGVMAWEYPDEALRSVCRDCHKLRSEAERVLLRALHSFNAETLLRLSDTIEARLVDEALAEYRQQEQAA